MSTAAPFPLHAPPVHPMESRRAQEIADLARDLVRRIDPPGPPPARRAGRSPASRPTPERLVARFSSLVPGRLSFTRVKAAEASVRRAVRDPIRRARAGIPWTRRDTLLLLGGLVLLAVTAAFQVQPARPLPETELKMHLAELQLLPALSDDPRDSAQFFAEKLMDGWKPDTLFRSVHPDFWRRENGRGPNETVAGVVDGFRAFDAAHGRIITANGREGTLEFRTVRTRDGRDYLGNVVTLQAEFGDGTTRRITLTLIPSARRPGSWSIWEISAPPFLTP